LVAVKKNREITPASFKSRLKTHLFNQTFRPTCSKTCPTCHQFLWSHDRMVLYKSDYYCY